MKKVLPEINFKLNPNKKNPEKVLPVNNSSNKKNLVKALTVNNSSKAIKKVANIQRFPDIDSGHLWTINLDSDYKSHYNLSAELSLRTQQIYRDNSAYTFQSAVMLFYKILYTASNEGYAKQLSPALLSHKLPKSFDLFQFAIMFFCFPENIELPMRERMLLYVRLEKLMLRIAYVALISEQLNVTYALNMTSFIKNPLLGELLGTIRMKNFLPSGTHSADHEIKLKQTLAYINDLIRKVSKQALNDFNLCISTFMSNIICHKKDATDLKNIRRELIKPWATSKTHIIISQLYMLIEDSTLDHALRFMPEDAVIVPDNYLK